MATDEVTEPTKLTYGQCVVKKSTTLYKRLIIEIGIWLAILGGVCIVAILAALSLWYALVVLPAIITEQIHKISAMFSWTIPYFTIIPWWGYVIGLVCAIPLFYSLVWCYAHRNDIEGKVVDFDCETNEVCKEG